MKRNEPCAHMRPDYDRMEEAVYIFRHPVTDEITWQCNRNGSNIDQEISLTFTAAT